VVVLLLGGWLIARLPGKGALFTRLPKREARAQFLFTGLIVNLLGTTKNVTSG